MTTFEDLLRAIQQSRFVGREAELARLAAWLADPDAKPVMAVSGPGGIGKSWLLDVFTRTAAVEAWEVVVLDVGDLDDRATLPLPEPARTVFVIDGVDAVGPALAGLLRHLAGLQVGNRVVLSSRGSLAEGVWRRWEPLIDHLHLEGLDPGAQRRYLDLRGVDDPAQRAAVQLRSRGNPLIMSLAVDALLGAGALGGDATVRIDASVASVLGDVMAGVDPDARQVLEAAAVLHHFDTSTLMEVADVEATDRGMLALFTSSGVRRVGSRFALHDELRWALREDLRLHAPERLRSLRQRALRYYRLAAEVASSPERDRLLTERFHLIGRDVLGISLLYEGDASVVIDHGGPGDMEDMVELLARTSKGISLPPVERDPSLLRPLLADPDTRIQLCRDGDGNLRAYGFYVRVSERTRPLLAATPGMARVLDAAASALGIGDGRFPGDSNVLYLSSVVTEPGDWAVVAEMSRSIMDLFFLQGAHLAIPGSPEYAAVVAGAGARHVATEAEADGTTLDSWLLDFSRCSTEGLLSAGLAGEALEWLPIGEELARLAADVLGSWDDDSAVADSPLSMLVSLSDDPASERADAVRALLRRAIDANGPWPTPEWRLRDALGLLEPAALGPLAFPAPRTGTTRAAEIVAAGLAGNPHIQLLGRFAVTHDGVEVQVPAGVVMTVVQVLAVRRTVSADELIDLLWPGTDSRTGRERLRTALARVRRVLGPDAVARHGEELRLSGAVTTDVHTFTTLAETVRSMPPGSARAETAARAAAAYAGELLPGQRYSDWSSGPRQRLGHQYASVVGAIVEEARESGRVDAALDALERAIEVEPYEESNYLSAAELLSAAGRRGAALAMLERAEAAMTLLGVAGSTELRRLQVQLRSVS